MEFRCEECRSAIGADSAYLAVYDNERYYPFMIYLCPECKPEFIEGSGYDRGFRNGRSQATEAVRRENRELKERLRITTELLEGKTPSV